MSLVSTDERSCIAIGLDRFGFHVLVDGAAVFGPLLSRAAAEDIAEIWARAGRRPGPTA